MGGRCSVAATDHPDARAAVLEMLNRDLEEVARGLTLNDAIAKVLPANRRSWAVRRIPAYREQGIEALIDARTPREPTVSRECAHAVQAARETNPRVMVSEVLELLHKLRISPLPSASKIKRDFARVDERRKYARKKARAKGDVEVIELPLAGGELLAAAETENGILRGWGVACGG